MKKTYLYLAGAAALMLAGACAEERMDAQGEGYLAVSTSIDADMAVVSRASEQELAESCVIWISNDKGVVREYKGIDQVPDRIPLISGAYTVEAWAGDSVSASFEKRAFKGREQVELTTGESKAINLVCKIANVAACVDYSGAEGLDDVLKDYTMTVGHARGSLVFEGKDDRTGYFMMPSTDKNLAYELKGTQLDGREFSFSGVIENAQPATLYQLKVLYTPATNDIGGAIFTIEIDDRAITVEQNIELIAAPKIEGYGFDIASPVVAEPGTVGRRCVYISSAAEIKSLELTSDWLLTIPVLGGNDVDLLQMNEVGIAAVNGAGINFKNEYNAETDQTLIQLNFEEEMTNALPKGEYSFAIAATDAAGRKSAATLVLSVNDAPVQTLDANDVTPHSAVLRALLGKVDGTTPGFRYHVKGSDVWYDVEATVNGSELSALVTGLKGNTTYEYTATAGDFVSVFVKEFTTGNDQLPNSGFEEWSTAGDGSEMMSADPNNFWWDSGNHGSRTMKTNITYRTTDYIHSGNAAICLHSQFVGVGALGKFAAGNVFAGQYLKTDGTDGVLGWGRPWTLKPKQLKVWAKYEPAVGVSKKGAVDGYIGVGQPDQGIIYVALTDGTTNVDSEYPQWPCVIRTKTKQLFDKNGANIVAYGEHVFEAATDGNGMVEITVDLNDVHPDLDVAHIIIVASASRYGDYFSGGDGSKLYLDDIELVY